MVSCRDTGESVMMRIVVDTGEGRPDVPDGRQKGVMDWTWTPSWVNGYVPIN
jgi:hypothetical protein